MTDDPTRAIVELDAVSKVYRLPRARLTERRELAAVRGADVTVRRGRTIGVVGESGSGKTTLGRLALALTPPTDGVVRIDGIDMSTVRGAELRRLRRSVQAVFQDPTGALNPRRTVRRSVEEPLRVGGGRGRALHDRVDELLLLVGIDPRTADRRPGDFSGGQRQRVVIARALAADPAAVVADEPVSALDASVQAQVLNLFRDLQQERGLGCLFISHDLAVVGFVADDIAVMYLGRLVETGPAADVLAGPAHPYTRALRAAADMTRSAERDGAAEPPARGCPYADRCSLVMPVCHEQEPELLPVAADRRVACHAVTGP